MNGNNFMQKLKEYYPIQFNDDEGPYAYVGCEAKAIVSIDFKACIYTNPKEPFLNQKHLRIMKKLALLNLMITIYGWM